MYGALGTESETKILDLILSFIRGCRYRDFSDLRYQKMDHSIYQGGSVRSKRSKGLLKRTPSPSSVSEVRSCLVPLSSSVVTVNSRDGQLPLKSSYLRRILRGYSVSQNRVPSVRMLLPVSLWVNETRLWIS